jgi:pilus assembly protein CpaE
VGATTIVTNMVWNLAERLKRRVALVDLDLYSGDAALQLDAAHTHALHEALEHPERVDDLFLDRATIHVTERLSLLSSLEKLAEFTVPKEEAVLPLLEKLINRHRYVIVDVPPAPASRLPRMLCLPSVCLLVSDASLVSARDVVRWREVIGSSGPERQILHILNKNGSHGSLPVDKFIQAAGQAPDITIPYDRDIGVASNIGVRGVQKCAALQHGLLPLFSLVAGEAAQPRQSLLHRFLGRA